VFIVGKMSSVGQVRGALAVAPHAASTPAITAVATAALRTNGIAFSLSMMRSVEL